MRLKKMNEIEVKKRKYEQKKENTEEQGANTKATLHMYDKYVYKSITYLLYNKQKSFKKI